VSEGHSGTRAVTFTVTLSAPYDRVVTVDFATANSLAVAGSDYHAASGTLTFEPGQTTKTVLVLVNGDRFGEPDETFAVNLSGATNALVADGQGIGTILDDEPRIRVTDVTKAEGGRNKTTLFTFTVTLSAAYDQPVTVSYRTLDNSATTSDNDYVARTGTLTFAPGETSKTVTIEVKGDRKKEGNEYFLLVLHDNSSNSLLTDNLGEGWILNDDR
jgi:Calx-beta domain